MVQPNYTPLTFWAVPPGAIRFQADVDFSEGTTRCNCSICTKARAWFTIVKADHFHMIAAAGVWPTISGCHLEDLSPTRITASATPAASPSHREQEAMGGAFHAVTVASLDGVDPEELAMSFVDGRLRQIRK
jgi:hypothetical protein